MFDYFQEFRKFAAVIGRKGHLKVTQMATDYSL